MTVGRLLRALVVCVAFAGGAAFVGCTAAPLPTSPALVLASPGTMAICELIDASDLSASVGSEFSIVDEATSATACTYRTNGIADAAFDVAIRVEDSFSSLADVQQTFVDGVVVDSVGDGAYWSASIGSVWFVAHERLYAVQLIGFEGSDETARQLAVAVATQAVARLADSG